MIIIGNIEEINGALQYFKPGFPRQNLENLEANGCFYILNQVPVEIILRDVYQYQTREGVKV